MAFEYGAQTGVKALYFAELLQDDETGAVYDAPYKICDVIQIKPSFEYMEGRLDASNKVIRESKELSGMGIQIITPRIMPEIEAKLLGHKMDADGGVLDEDGDTPIEGALLYELTFDNAASRYCVIYKGVFSDFAEETETKKKGATNYQTPTLEFRGYRRTDGKLRYRMSTESTGYSKTKAAAWYAEVQEPPTV